MDLVIKETGSKIRGRVRAYTSSMIVAHLSGPSRKTSLKEKVN
jgi:hypothetical protein